LTGDHIITRVPNYSLLQKNTWLLKAYYTRGSEGKHSTAVFSPSRNSCKRCRL